MPSSLLLLSIGPVQDFIAAARSTRDLWSGSYLLSTLISSALTDLKIEFSEEAVVFPQIKNQALVSGLPSNSTDKDIREFLTPTLPNRLLAVIPSDKCPEETANKLTKIISDKLTLIANTTADKLEEKIQTPELKRQVNFNRTRFDEQITNLLNIQWQTLQVPESVEELKQLANLLPQSTESFDPRKGLESASAPSEAWGTLTTLASWLLDGTKSMKGFSAWRQGRWNAGAEFNKDSLNGKEEAVLTFQLNSPTEAENLAKELGLSKTGIKQNEILGASTVIKRFWSSYYLTTLDGLPPSSDRLREKHPMPNTHDIANYKNNVEDASPEDVEKYYAVIAFDGDEMGKWISGQKHDKGLQLQDHQNFSACLNTFAVDHAHAIIEDSNGKLIYAGGDDVLAMVPSANSISCAQDLAEAFIETFTSSDAALYKSINGSAGIAIAHVKTPLQDVVQYAMKAEKRAKQEASEGGIGRSGYATTVIKRSGEILHWGAQWESKGNELYKLLCDALTSKDLNTRFPHKLEALLIPYLPQSEAISTLESFESSFTEILTQELDHCLKRNQGGSLTESQTAQFINYWQELQGPFKLKLQTYINLLRTVAWSVRNAADNNQTTQKSA